MTARAWCRSTTCGGKQSSKTCTPPELVMQGACVPPEDEPDCGGFELKWPRGCTGFSVQENASKQIGLADARKIVRQAFDTWESAPCGAGGTPHIHVDD